MDTLEIMKAKPSPANILHCKIKSERDTREYPIFFSFLMYQNPTIQAANGVDMTINTSADSFHFSIAMEPIIKEITEEYIVSRAVSPTLRIPLSTALCEPAKTVSATPKESQPMTTAIYGSANIF